MAEILIRRGADVNAYHEADPKPRTPIQLAVEQGNVQFVDFLLRNGAKLESPDWFYLQSPDEYSPIRTILNAPITKRKEMMQLLIKSEEDIKHKTRDGMNLLNQLICYYQSDKDHYNLLELAKILLDIGVPANELDLSGNTQY